MPEALDQAVYSHSKSISRVLELEILFYLWPTKTARHSEDREAADRPDQAPPERKGVRSSSADQHLPEYQARKGNGPLRGSQRCRRFRFAERQRREAEHSTSRPAPVRFRERDSNHADLSDLWIQGGSYRHEMLDHPVKGRDCHLVECLACGQRSLFTKSAFDSIADRVETA